MTALWTIGYEGAAIEDFLDTLRRAGITKVLDVREIPVSRRKGFSKTALKQALTGRGIDYQHERRLGSPRGVRHRLRATGDLECFFHDYEAHLRKQQDLLDELAGSLQGGVVLLCYERDPSVCHRAIVARALKERTGLEPNHLSVIGKDGQAKRTRLRPR